MKKFLGAIIVLGIAFYCAKQLDLFTARSWPEVEDRLRAALMDKHVAKITIWVDPKSDDPRVGVHFSRYDGPVTIGVDYAGFRMRIPTDVSRFTKLANCDDSNQPECRVRPNTPFIKTVDVEGNGIYLLDIADWDDDPHLHIQLVMDGRVRFEGDGTKDNFDAWDNKFYGKKTRKTDPREIAIDLQ